MNMVTINKFRVLNQCSCLKGRCKWKRRDIIVGCVLAEPCGPWRLTFTLGRQGYIYISFSYKTSLCWAPYVLQFQSTTLVIGAILNITMQCNCQPWKLRVLSKSQNWPARPWLGKSFWQINKLFPGLLIFRRKKSKISRDFQGQIRGKIGRFRGIFAGKKSKFAEKLAHFAGF